MRRKPYVVTDLSKGYDASMIPTLLTDGASSELSNVRFDKGLIKKDLGYRAFVDDSPERPMALFKYQKWTGSLYHMLATVDDLYYLSGGVWTQVGSSPSFTGDEDDQFSCTICQDHFVITNFVDTIYKFDGTTMSVLGGLTNVYAKTVTTFYNTLVLGYTEESGVNIPYRIKWSEVGDFETWSGGNSGYLDLLDTPDHIVNVVNFRDRLFVFKEWSIWEIIYVGESGSNFFDKKLINDHVGTYAGGSIVSVGNEILFFGADALYAFDGLDVIEIATPIRPLLYETGVTIVDHSRLNRAVAAYQEEVGDYVLVLPTKSNAEPNLVVKYNTRTKTITKRTKQVSALGYYTASGTTTSWTEAKSAGYNWNDSQWAVPWKRFTLPEGAPTLLYAGTDGTIEEDDRVTLSTEEMIWISKDFVFAQSQRWLWAELWAKGDAFYFSYSTNGGLTWSLETQYVPDATEILRVLCFCEVTADKIRFKIRTTGQLEFYLPTPWYVDRARSTTAT